MKEKIKKEKIEVKGAMDESVAYRAEKIFARNWFIIAIFSFCVVFYAVYVSEKAIAALVKIEKTVYESSLYTVMTTVDGRSIKVNKTRLEAKFIEKWLAKTIVSNFIISRSELTKGFQINSFKTPKEVIKSSYKLRYIYEDLISDKEKQAQKDLRTYIFKLQSMLGNDTLPEYITINSYSTTYFRFNDSKFSMKVNAKVGTINYDISRDKKYARQGEIPIEIEGYVDLSRSTELNPYGLIIKTFTIGVMVK